MTTTTETTKCPATGRSAAACADRTHAACYQGAGESNRLDRKIEREFRRIDESY